MPAPCRVRGAHGSDAARKPRSAGSECGGPSPLSQHLRIAARRSGVGTTVRRRCVQEEQSMIPCEAVGLEYHSSTVDPAVLVSVGVQMAEEPPEAVRVGVRSLAMSREVHADAAVSEPARKGGPLERSADRRERNAGRGQRRGALLRGRGGSPSPLSGYSTRPHGCVFSRRTGASWKRGWFRTR